MDFLVTGIADLLSGVPPGARICYYICLFFMGAVISDFFQCMIFRHTRRIDIFIKRSFCDSCGRSLKWYHLIPVLSYIGLRGRCAFCKSGIDIRYPVSDFSGGAIVTLMAFADLWIPLFIFYSILLVFVSACDYLAFRVPFVSLLFFFILASISRLAGGEIGMDPIQIAIWAAALLSLALPAFSKSRFSAAVAFALISAVALTPISLPAEAGAALLFAFAYALTAGLAEKRVPRLSRLPAVSLLAAGFACALAFESIFRV